MNAPLLTLTWSDGEDNVNVYYDADANTWSSDYEEPIISEAYITMIQALTEPVLNALSGTTAYTPYPFIERLVDLSEQMGFGLSGVTELVAYLNNSNVKPGVAY
jgi:hypothetical protein